MILTPSQALAKYGVPNETGEGYLTKIELPYPMRIAWDTSHTVNSMRCHHLVADNFTEVFKEILEHYGFDAIKNSA